jgi:hypothetical protein
VAALIGGSGRGWIKVAAATVVGVAALQGALIVLFAAFAMSGDDLGIAKSMAIMMCLPFVAITIPALALLWRGRIGWASLSTGLSVLLLTLLWWRA